MGKLGHYLVARAQIAQGNFDAALESITTGDALHATSELTADMRDTDYPQVRLWLAQRKLNDLAAWLEACDLNLEDISHFKTQLTFTMHARVMLALHVAYPDHSYLKEAQVLLQSLYDDAYAQGWYGRVIEILALQSLALGPVKE